MRLPVVDGATAPVYLARMKCPACGAAASGRFCSACGAPLKEGACASCGTRLDPGARFCSECGTPVAGVRKRASAAPWIAGILAFAILAVVLVVRATEPDPNVAPAAPAGGGIPGPMGGTMRDNADRLFNRVMAERETGNTQQAEFFTPMAIQAYEASGDLDADGLYHLALLHLVAGQHDTARATAERILATSPGHLLALATAAEASALAGDSGRAAEYYRTFVENYESERVKPLQEYLDHARILPEYKAAAETFLR